MFGKVLFATDLSPASDAVLEYLKSLQTLGCTEIVLTYVIYVKHTIGLAEAILEEATPELQEQKTALESAGFSVSVETPLGVPGPAITDLAIEKGCSLIVIGSHGHSMAREIALGSVATDVIHRSQIPVLVVRLAIVEKAGKLCCEVTDSDILSNILYATDFSDNAEYALKYAENLVQNGCKKVTLVHVQDASRISSHLKERLEEFNSIDQARLERIRDRLLEIGAETVDIQLLYGTPAKEILDQIKEACPSLVIMGAHGRGFIADMFLGSVSHNVVRYSNSPMLLVPMFH